MDRSGSSRSSRASQIQRNSPQTPQNEILHINYNIDGREFVTGRVLAYPAAATELVVQQLATLGWANLPNCVSANIGYTAVTEFYRHARISYMDGNPLEPEINTNVFGRPIYLNKQVLANFLGLENDGDCIFLLNGKKALKNALGFNDLGILRATIATPEFISTGESEMVEQGLRSHLTNVNCFLIANVVPTVGTNGRVSHMRQFLLYCIVTDRRVNFPYIFFKHVERTLSINMKLGYASTITYILQNGFGLALHLRPGQSGLDETNLRRRRNHPYIHDEQPQEEEEEEQQQQQQDVGLSQFDHNYTRWDYR